MDIPSLVEYTNLRSFNHHIIYVPFYVPEEHPKFQDPDQVFFVKVRSYLKQISPSLRDEDVIEMHASRY